jgi:hypothetical protein
MRASVAVALREYNGRAVRRRLHIDEEPRLSR